MSYQYVYETCSRCGGSGRLGGYEYTTRSKTVYRNGRSYMEYERESRYNSSKDMCFSCTGGKKMVSKWVPDYSIPKKPDPLKPSPPKASYQPPIYTPPPKPSPPPLPKSSIKEEQDEGETSSIIRNSIKKDKIAANQPTEEYIKAPGDQPKKKKCKCNCDCCCDCLKGCCRSVGRCCIERCGLTGCICMFSSFVGILTFTILYFN